MLFARFFLCPETGGKTLEQVDYLFQKPLADSKRADLENTEDGDVKHQDIGITAHVSLKG